MNKEYKVLCPYCDDKIILKTETDVMLRIDLKNYMIITCPNCGKEITLTSQTCMPNGISNIQK